MRNKVNLNYSNFKIVFLSFLFVGSCVFLFMGKALAVDEYQMQGELNYGDYDYKTYSLSNRTEIEQKDSGKLSLQDNRDYIKFYANDTGLSVYLLNGTQMADVLLNGSNLSEDFTIPSKYKYDTDNILEFKKELKYEDLFEMDFETVLVLGENDQLVIYFTILVVNEKENEEIQYSLEFPFENELSIFIQRFAEMMIWMVFLIIGTFLLYDAKKTKDENPMISNAYRNFGIALYWAAAGTAAWAFYHWYRWMTHDMWVNPFTMKNAPEGWPLSANYLSFFTFMAAGFSLLFMNMHVEKNIQQRSKPYQSYALILMEILFILGIIVPSILLYIFFVWAIVVFSVVLNLTGVYFKMAIKSTGVLRKKSALILVGMTFTYFSIIGREFIVPDYYANFFGAFFCIVMYYGIKMEAI